MQAIHIDATKRTVEIVELPDTNQLPELQRLVGGWIEIAHRFTNGDVLFVNEEGLLKNPTNFFHIGAHQPFAGNGVIVGPEIEEEPTDPQTPIEFIRQIVQWMNVMDVRYWAQNRRS